MLFAARQPFDYFDTAFWKSFSQAGSVDFDFSFLLSVPEVLDDSVDDDAEEEGEPDHVAAEKLVDEADDEPDPLVPSLSKLSGPQTESTSCPTFHFSGIRLLGTAWN